MFTYVSLNKHRIITQVTNEIGKKLSGKVSIGNVGISFLKHFPKVSVVLYDIQITDTLFTKHQHPFFQAKQVSLKLGILDLVKKQQSITGFRIDDGSFYLYTDTTGYTNRYLFHPGKDSSAQSSGKKRNILTSIVLKNVRITLDDQQKNKLYDVAVNDLDLKLDDRDDSSFMFFAKANMLVHSLAFNKARGSFIKEKTFIGDFELQYAKFQKQLILDSIDVNVGGQALNLSARFDLAGEDPQFSLRLHTKQITYPLGKSFLTPKIDTALSFADVDKPLDVDADISGPLKIGDPLVVVNWSIKNAHLVTPFVSFDSASFKGYYTDEVSPGLPRTDPNSKIVITNFSANWQDLPVSSNNMEIVNLVNPLLTCDLHSEFSFAKLDDILGSNALDLRNGNCVADITYKGPIYRNNNTNSFVNGSITLKNGSIWYAPREVEMKNVNGRIIFKNSTVLVEDLQCEVLNNKITMQGRAENLLSLINSEPNKANISWNIYSPSLNFNAFTFLLANRKKVNLNGHSKHKLIKIASKIDEVLDEGSLNIILNTDRLIYKKFLANNVKANVVLLQDQYLLKNVSMEHAGGRIQFNGSVLPENNYRKAAINVNLENVDVTRIMESFSEFGQEGITSQNLRGKLSATIAASMKINTKGTAEPKSIESIVDFSLKDGELVNYEPIKKLQNFLFKNRDFDNIRFAELKDKLEIKDGEIKINRMEIQSSVMSLFLEGLYSNKGNTDISIQVPLRNIHKRGLDYNPENIGTEKKGGTSIYVRGRPGPDGKIKFKLDLFHKYKKDKERSAL